MPLPRSGSRKRIARRQMVAVVCAFSVLFLGLVTTQAWPRGSVREAAGGFIDARIREAARDITVEKLPVLLEIVADKDAPRRRETIQMLGVAGFSEALPALEAVLNDDSEKDFIRAEALLAIFSIDDERARSYAEQYREEISQIGRVAEDILSGNAELVAPRSLLKKVLESL